MNIRKQLLENDSEYIYEVTGIENYNVNSSASYRFWFNHLRKIPVVMRSLRDGL